MTTIAVENIPEGWNLRRVAISIAYQVKGHVEPLGFDHSHYSHGYKVALLEVSEQVDPAFAIKTINQMSFDKKNNLIAYVKNNKPGYQREKRPPGPTPPVSKKFFAQKRQIKQQQTGVAAVAPHKVLQSALKEIMMELQRKYPQLVPLSKSFDDEDSLMENIGMAVFRRLHKLGQGGAPSHSHAWTRAYRAAHPHFADFQFVLSNLHELETKKGLPKTELVESEFMAVPKTPYLMCDMPQKKVSEACNKYSDRVSKKVIEHIQSLDSEAASVGDEARRRVRVELKKMTPYIHNIMQQIINKHFTPAPKDSIKMVIYGEPVLPAKNIMVDFLAKYRALPPLAQSKICFNCFKFNIGPTNYAMLMAMDGTVVSGAKLVIRMEDVAPPYKISPSIRAEVHAAYGVVGEPEKKHAGTAEEDQMDEDEMEDFPMD